jgi:hypothetical protein
LRDEGGSHRAVAGRLGKRLAAESEAQRATQITTGGFHVSGRGKFTEELNSRVKRLNKARLPLCSGFSGFNPGFPGLTSKANIIDLQWSRINIGFP